MATITLASALKLKKRLIREISLVSGQIQSRNVFYEDSLEATFDMPAALARLEKLSDTLVTLKTRVNEANVVPGINGESVASLVNMMGEKKARIAMLNRIESRPFMGYGAIEKPVLVHMNADDVAKQVKTLQGEIDLIQDCLDAYNATATIDLSIDISEIIAG